MAHVERRKHPRLDTIQEGDCINLVVKLPEVWLIDLTVSGCQVIIQEGHLAPGQQVVIRPENFAGLPAVVRWVHEDRAGLEFVSELSAATFDHLIQSKLNVEQCEAVSSVDFIDQFGRILPGLRPFTLYQGAT